MSEKESALAANEKQDEVEDEVVEQPEKKSTLTVEQLQDELAKARREAAKYRTEKKAAETSKLSETEKLAKEVAEMRSELAHARRIAIAAKFKLPEALADRLKGETVEELETDAKALAAILPQSKNTEHPKDQTNEDAEDKKTPEIDPTNPKNQPRLTKEAIEKMSPMEINKNWDAISAALENKDLK